MKFFVAYLFFTSVVFADTIVLNNESNFPKIAIQWASNAKMAQENNESLMQDDPINPSDLTYPRKAKETISIPKNAAYFRVVAWEGKQKQPDFLTNWVEVVPNKTYQLKEEHLTPILLMNGMGC